MANFFGKVQSLLLIILGLSTGWFALFSDYWLLMNPKFTWLTTAGAIVIFAMGASSLFTSAMRPTYSAIMIFALLAVIVLLGRPFLKSTNASITPIRPDAVKSSSFLAGSKFKMVDLIDLHRSTQESQQEIPSDLFVTSGLIKRSPLLEKQGHVALVKPLVYCCLADAMVIGFRVRYVGKTDAPIGWVNVLGRLKKLDTPLPAPNLQLGAARFSLIDKDYVIEPVKIVPYERQLPTIANELPVDKFGMFWKAIKAAGLSEILKTKGPITLFVPVDAGFYSLPVDALNNLFESQSKAFLEKLLKNHIVPGKLLKNDLFELNSITTINNRNLKVRVDNGSVSVENARIIFSDTEVNNGVIHVIYPAILPKGKVHSKGP